MNTFNIKVKTTNFSPFSGLNVYGSINGGSLIDGMAAPLSFYYPSSAFGGTIDLKKYYVGNELDIPHSVFFKNDGTKMYVLGVQSNFIPSQTPTPTPTITPTIGGPVSPTPTPTPTQTPTSGGPVWILESGTWSDTGIWIDTKNWKDS